MHTANMSIPVLVGDQEKFALQLDKQTPAAKTYRGPASVATFNFSVLNTTLGSFNDWLADKSVGELTEAAKEQGSDVLRVRLWEGDSSVWRFTVNYRVEITLSKPAGVEQDGMASMAAAWVGIVIVIAALAFAYWAIVKPLLTQLTDIVYGPVGEDGKRASWTTSGLILPAAVLIGIALFMGNKNKGKVKA